MTMKDADEDIAAEERNGNIVNILSDSWKLEKKGIWFLLVEHYSGFRCMWHESRNTDCSTKDSTDDYEEFLH